MKISLLLLIVFSAFGITLAIPAVDDPETAYDESDSQPYEAPYSHSDISMQQRAASQTAPSTDLVVRLRCLTTSDETAPLSIHHNSELPSSLVEILLSISGGQNPEAGHNRT